jgi:hypothetical protein
MTTIYLCLAVAFVIGLVCFIIEKSDWIHLHIDRHHDAILAALTGGTTGFFLTLFVTMITKIL